MGDLSAFVLDKFLCFLSGCRLHDITELCDTFANRSSLFFEVFHDIRMSFLKVCICRKNHFVYVIIRRIFSVGIRDFAIVERIQTDMPCNVYCPLAVLGTLKVKVLHDKSLQSSLHYPRREYIRIKGIPGAVSIQLPAVMSRLLLLFQILQHFQP